ncbi:tetratricopeptide repeat protein [Dysgonomonas alginatilytica]|uniref:Tetratricopeptide repeat protein n=1 Tax=Dysgonomonas alginatilytica TaxID=1605892 RepID=A0A2V3PNQ9_9BACT|nr:tetratricopeptide repeat protein [Dysgonomonas alginatilytica]PXV62827.1 tetratricopeptide repeat protein [Dysgonomonas alginatilytica]
MKISTHILLLLLLCLFISCKKENASVNLLRQAQNIVENKPNEALVLLDSIQNTENLDADSYMQYIVTKVDAKYKTKQEISGDTLIFEAQKYFDGSKNVEQAALADYYAGIVNRKINRYDKSLISFLKAGVNSAKTGNNRLSGKIFENIGFIYLEQGALDSAVLNYKKAVNYYILEKDSASTMRTTNQVGRCYEDLVKLDSAYVYFSNALQIAENINDEKYKSNITLNLGVIRFGMSEYDKAIAYFESVLSLEATTQERVRQTNIMLLNAFSLKNDLSSAKEFALKVEASIPDVTDMHTKEEMYAALTNYYKQTGNYKQALHFNELEKETIQQIAKEERPVELIKADTDFRVEQKDRIYGELQSDFYLFLLLSIAAAILISVFVVINYRQNKKDKEIFRSESEKYDLMRRHLEASNRDYDRIQAEIKDILEGNQ